MKIKLFLGFLFLISSPLFFGQEITYPPALNIDLNYAYLQFYNNEQLTKFATHFQNVDKDKLVILHYGGSHIQAENPTTIARANFHQKYGSGGRGLMFNYSAANTYSTVNYSSSKKGNWKYAKSFQARNTALPIGVCGMTVETTEAFAELNFKLKNVIAPENHDVYLFFENDSISYDVDVYFDSVLVNSNDHQLQFQPYGLSVKYKEGIQAIRLVVKPKLNAKRFRFYGLSVENEENSGVVYHSTGVGAAAFRSVLLLDKMPDQASVLKPDMVILDFGTNDILSTNKIDLNLEKQVLKSINKFRAVNPEIIIILTTTQDLFYKGKPVTACFAFRDLMESIARKNDCFFWNWFDLAGGTKTIKTWNAEGYAQNDCIHLTKKGYQVKGQLLFESFENTLCLFRDQPDITDYAIPGKLYTDYVPVVVIPNTTNTIVVDSSTTVSDSIPPKVIKVKPPKVIPKPVLKKYVVKKGDTLSQIAERNRTSVSKIMKANRMRSDRLSIGQVLVIPK